MTGPVLGIDLGTTNSVVAVADAGHARVLADSEGRRLLPSVVSFTPSGPIVVGYEARERRLVDAANTVYSIKRLIGRPYDSPEVERARDRFAFKIEQNKFGGTVVNVRKGQYTLAEISAMVLRECRRIAELSLETVCETAVVTVPANFNELQRSATKAAGRVASLEVLRIINEPTAAALAYGFGGGAREKIAVYDLGGGTFDLTILELENDVFEVIATSGDTFLGGEDLDEAVAEAMSEAFVAEHRFDPRSDRQAFERLKAAAEWAKCQLSRETKVRLSVEELAFGPHGRSLDLNFDITREQLDHIIHPWLARSFEVCNQALATAGLETSDIDSVVLVGGSTRIPLCRAMVQRYFQKVPRADIDPDLVVAQGAAIYAATLGGGLARTSQVGRVSIQKISKAELDLRHKTREPRPTLQGVPRQPAFAPAELPAAPPSRPPPSGKPRPKTIDYNPHSALDRDLEGLRPPDHLTAPNALDALAPPSFLDVADPFSDFTPSADPFTSTQLPDLPGAAYVPGEKKVGARSPTGPFLQRATPTQPHGTDEEDGPLPPTTPMGGSLPTSAAASAYTPSIPVPIASALPPIYSPPPPAPTHAMPVVALPNAEPPLLMDVTPLSLGVETVGGYCRRLINKNAPVPTEQTRNFSTASDGQREVAVRICQGEGDTFADNQVLGEVLLTNLPSRPRGQLTIVVTFILDANGTLAVRAVDAESQVAQEISINLRGGLSHADIMGMRLRLESEDIH